MKASHVVGLLVVVGLAIYFFSKTKVTGTVTADESGAIVSPSIAYNSYAAPLTMPARAGLIDTSRAGTSSFGTELRQ